MPKTRAQVEALRAECFAEDVPLPPNAESMAEKDLQAYFESGGHTLPPLNASNPDFHLLLAKALVLANTSPTAVGRLYVARFNGRKSQIQRPMGSSFL